MEDDRIVELYRQRDESAIKESAAKYGAYCGKIAYDILHSAQDAEECVNDTWLRAWNAIPPEKPRRLAVFFGKIVRNLAIDRYRRDRSGKYGGGQAALCLDELEECIGEDARMEDDLALREIMNGFLRSLPEKNREVFLMRYWYFMPITEIASQSGVSEGSVKMTLRRLRDKLKEYLKKEGVGI